MMGSKASVDCQGNRLIQAACGGDLQTVKELLKTGVDPNWHEESSNETALRTASQAGHIDVVEFLLNHGAEIDFSIDDGSTALVEASTKGHWEVTKILLQHGANPFRRDDFEDQTPVWMAASHGQESIISYMIENAPDNQQRGQIVQEVLLGAAYGGNLGLVRSALDNGAEINARGFHGETAIMEAARSGHADVISFLLAHGADVHVRDDSGNTALVWAVRSGSVTPMQVLIDAGSDIRHRNRAVRDRHIRFEKDGTKIVHEQRHGLSILEYACASSNPDVVKLLLDLGLDVQERDSEGRTLLMLSHCPEITELLLHRGVVVDARDPNGWTALIHAAWQGHVEVMKTLIAHGADVNVQCLNQKWTPLIAACESDLISILEKQRDNSKPMNDHPILLATAKLLEEFGADINAMDAHGRTAIWYAFRYQCLDVVEFLLEKGAQSDICDDSEEELRQASQVQARSHLLELLDAKKSREESEA